jgi:hypothetical protein
VENEKAAGADIDSLKSSKVVETQAPIALGQVHSDKKSATAKGGAATANGHK